jgi:hypothetical protein
VASDSVLWGFKLCGVVCVGLVRRNMADAFERALMIKPGGTFERFDFPDFDG